jgi:hypothetical protein
MTTKPTTKPAVPSSSSGTKLPTPVRRNPMLFAGGAGVVAVALLALRARSKAGAAGGSSTVTAPAAPGSPTYDSVSSDVYNSMQPQIEALFAGQQALNERLTNAQDILDPASPAGSPAAAPTSTSNAGLVLPSSTASGYGADPERPGTFAFLNPYGYRDLGDSRNYPLPPMPSSA